MKSYVGIVLILAVLAGCASSPSVNLANRTVSSSEIHEAVFANQSRIQSMRGEGKVTIETPELAQTASFMLILQKPDSVMLRIEGPFGIEVGAAIVTRDEFLFYNILQNKVFTGSSNPENLSKILRVKVNFEDLVNLFSGGSFLAEDGSSGDEIIVEENQFVVTYAGRLYKRRYWVDPNTLLILKIQHFGADGKLFFDQRFDKHRMVEGISIPHIVQLTLPRERRRVSISYSELALNVPPERFSIIVPTNAERIRIQ